MEAVDVAPCALELRENRFRVVTADRSRGGRGEPIREFLARIRAAFGMDVVFVSRFVQDRRVVRFVAADPQDEHAVPEGASDPLEESYCHHVVEGRLPAVIPDTAQEPLAMSIAGTQACRVGCHLAATIVGPDGSVYGTVCCFSHEPRPALGAREEQEALREIAVLLAEALGKEGRAPGTPG